MRFALVVANRLWLSLAPLVSWRFSFSEFNLDFSEIRGWFFDRKILPLAATWYQNVMAVAFSACCRKRSSQDGPDSFSARASARCLGLTPR